MKVRSPLLKIPGLSERDRNFLSVMILATDLAMKEIRKIRRTGFTIYRKEDDSPVTRADQASEKIILSSLGAAFPEIPRISEEDWHARRESVPPEACIFPGLFFLVDPLDGTRGFVEGRDEFCVNIGLLNNHRPFLGVVGIPPGGEIFFGGPETGAWKISALYPENKPVRIHASPFPKTHEGVRVLFSRSSADQQRIAERIGSRTIKSFRQEGSAIKIMAIAEGQADFYPRFGPTMEWDTAGPEAVLEGAGGRLRALDGQKLLYGAGSTFKTGKGLLWENPPFEVFGQK